MISILIDGAIFIGLIITLTQNRIQNKKINILKSALLELGPIIEKFSKDVDRSEHTVKTLKDTTDEAIQNLNTNDLQKKPNEDQPQINIIETDTVYNSENIIKDKVLLIDEFFKLTRRGK